MNQFQQTQALRSWNAPLHADALAAPISLSRLLSWLVSRLKGDLECYYKGGWSLVVRPPPPTAHALWKGIASAPDLLPYTLTRVGEGGDALTRLGSVEALSQKLDFLSSDRN